jgi:hypothetical protein
MNCPKVDKGNAAAPKGREGINTAASSLTSDIAAGHVALAAETWKEPAP